MIKRLLSKSILTLQREGLGGFLQKSNLYLSKKIHKQRYFHVIGDHTEKRDVLFISGEPKNSTSFYRCDIPVEQLNLNGYKADVVYYKYLSKELIQNSKHIIWYRLGLSKEIESYVNYAKSLGKKIIFSVDDLVFDIDSVNEQSWLQIMHEADKRKFLFEVENMSKFMSLSDFGISSTAYLSTEMRQYIKGKIYILKNGFAQSSLRVGEQNSDWRTTTWNFGFFSGSETHDENFNLIKGDLLKLLSEFPQMKLHVGGRLEIPQEFKVYKDQIIKYGFSSFDDYLKKVSFCAIILVPLVDNRHNRCKSEIRAIQAGLVKRTVITSNTPVYSDLIDDNVGFLVKDTSDWYKIMKNAISDENNAREKGKNLYKKIISIYDPKTIGQELIKFLEKND